MVTTKRINVLPEKRRYETHFDLQQLFFKYGIQMLAVCFFAYAAFIFIPYMKEVGKIKKEIGKKQNELNRMEMTDENYTLQREKITTETKELIVKRDALKERMTDLRKEVYEKIFWEDVLAELARSIPDRTWVGSLSRQKNHLVIKGFAHSNSLIGELMARLDNSPLFENTRFISSEKLTEDDKHVVAYELQCDIVKKPD